MIFLAKKFVLSIIIRIFAASVPTKPLNDAQMRGAFLYVYVYSQNTLMERLPHFTKHYMTETDLVALLESRGLIISDEAKAHIFDQFYTGQGKTADNRRGLGLGLALCKSIVEAHGGTISVRDNQPGGVVFQFSLPEEEVTLHE